MAAGGIVVSRSAYDEGGSLTGGRAAQTHFVVLPVLGEKKKRSSC